jgi:NAD(P)-dependent dehydrogenase (short-subunit alcohol dehydrogenase family)
VIEAMSMGRAALVTGGGSGMGEATSHRLARDGMAVGVLDVDIEAARRVAGAVSEAGGQALAVQGDISDRSVVERAAAEVRAAFGPITVLINNAAVENFTPFGEIDGDDWDRLMSVNLKGAYIVSQTVLPDMLAAGWGRIVNISQHLRDRRPVGRDQHGPLHRLEGRAHRHDQVDGRRVRRAGDHGQFGVAGIHPDADEPPCDRGNMFPVPAEQIYQAYPIPRLGEPHEIAAACAYFASEDAGYVTGQVLGVNGGAHV